MSRPGLLRSMLSFSGVTMVSRVLGLARDWATFHVFGASVATDAFVIAFRIPNFMRRLFAEGSFSTAFVPVFTEVKEGGSHAELKELTARVTGTLAGAVLVVVALGMIFSPQLAMVFAPGAIHEPEKFGLIVDLLRLTFPYLLFMSLTALAGGALNSFHRFALPAFAPVVLNACMVVAALWLAPRLDVPILALGWATLAAGVLQLVLLLPAMRGLDLLALPRWGWRHAGVRKIFRLMVPTLFGASVGQINLLIDTVLISLLVTGSQTWIYQSTRFLELPLGVFGVALGTVILPALSRHHVETDQAGFSRALDWGLRTTLLISVPAMLALLMLAGPLLATIFLNGEYTVFDVRMAALSTMALACGVPSYALVKTVLPAFYSRQDTRTPVRAAVVALVSNMVFNVLLVALLYVTWATPEQQAEGWLAGIARVPGLHLGLAAASVLSNYLQFAQLWYWLKRAGVYDAQPGWLRHWARLLFACAAMAAVLGGLLWLWPWSTWTEVAVPTRVWRLATVVVAGALTYAGALFAVGLRLRDLRAV